MEFRNELREDCYWCHGKLTPHLSETVMGKYGDKEIISVCFFSFPKR